MRPDPKLTAEFLRYVHESAITNSLPGYLVVSERQPEGSKARYLSHGFGLDDLDAAADAFRSIGERGLNGYCRVHLMDRPLDRTTERGGGKATRWVTHFAADVDIAGPGHKPPADGRPLPPDLDAAVALIDATLPPSAIVASGGGLYPIWKLTHPLEVVDDDDRAAIAHYGRRLDAALSRHGYHVDATVCDLARIIRPPGSINNKPGRDPRPVEMLRHPDDGAGNFDLDDLEQALPLLPRPTAPDRPTPMVRRYRSAESSSAPWEMFASLYTLEDVLAADERHRWHRVRDVGGFPAWRRDGSESDYSIKQNPESGVVIVWSSVIAGELGIQPGSGLDMWGFANRLARRDPSRRAVRA